MSKELEALEKLAHKNNTLTDEERKLYKDVIEVNLEMYEDLKTKEMQTELELGEKETILNILIKKEVNIHNFKEFIIKQNWTYEQYLVEENDPNTNGHQFAYKLLTQEEFNVLKEALK